MSSEDQFTSVQWDRGETELAKEHAAVSQPNAIEEDDEVDHGEELPVAATRLPDADADPSNSLLVSGRDSEADSHHLGGHNQADEVSVSSLSSKQRAPRATECSDSDTHYRLTITVTDPQREMDTALKPYMSYLVTTITSNPSIIRLSRTKSDAAATQQDADPGADVVVKIRRRYGDFKFLYDCLCNDFPQVLVPPLPSKLNFKYLTGDTFSKEFVHKRLNSLNRFIKFISQHETLSQLKIVHLFVSNSSDWTTFQKNLKISKGVGFDQDGSSTDGGTLPSVVNKVVNEELLTETIMNFFTPSKHKRESNKEILEISDKLKKLYENLVKLDRIFAKLNKRNYDLSFDFEQFLNQITKLSMQPQNSDPVAGSDDHTTADTSDSVVTSNFKNFASSLSYFGLNWSSLHKYIDESFLVALKDCAKYIVSLTSLIELQHNKRIDLQVLRDYLARARAELSQMGVVTGLSGGHREAPIPVTTGMHSGGIVNKSTQLIKDTLSTNATGSIGSSHTDSKSQKLRARIEQLENEIEIQTAMVEDLTNRIIHEEYPFWDKFNKQELKESMLKMCDQQVIFYSGLVKQWGDTEATLLKRIKELS
jgi:sorting nexin-4